MSHDLVELARSWTGTPYRHQYSEKGVGCDCLGLIRGVYREAVGYEPEELPPYTAEWGGQHQPEQLIEAFNRHLVEIPVSEAAPGDVLAFRMSLGGAAKHCAILSGDDRILHAYWGKSVCETRLVPWWERRTTRAYRFPTKQEEAS